METGVSASPIDGAATLHSGPVPTFPVVHHIYCQMHTISVIVKRKSLYLTSSCWHVNLPEREVFGVKGGFLFLRGWRVGNKRKA